MSVDWDEIAARAETKQRQVMEAVVADTQERLSIQWPPSSRPGEYPHRRNGFLLRNVSQMTVRTGKTIRSRFMSNAWFSDDLERGRAATGRNTRPLLPRPFMRPSADRAIERLISGLRSEFSSK